MTDLLEVTGLRTEIAAIPVVDNVSFRIRERERLAIVGESGSGKTLTALSILRLVPEPPARITSGSITLEGRDLLRLSPAGIRAIRGRDIAMIFQEPMTSLNPVLTVGHQIEELLGLHTGLRGRAARDRAVALLRSVGIPDPARRVRAFPHELSGGTRQRVMIAMALASRPKLLIADEPTTALDVTVQAQLLQLLLRLQAEFGMAILLITHDLGIVAEFAERVLVMYAGRIVETGEVEDIFAHPLHPYTRGLIDSVPAPDRDVPELLTIEGTVPRPGTVMPGCRFAPRCPRATPACENGEPDLRELALARHVRCIHPLRA